MSASAPSDVGPVEDPHGPLKIGARLRKYEILALIGRGGYASVYHARDTIFKRDVAIKVIHRMGEVTEDMVRRGQAEAIFLSKMRHPNIVEVFDADITDGGLLYIVMELLVGRTLIAALREHRRLAVEEALDLGSQIATAVEAAHQLGAIHRDLKPENIFITAGNVIKVLDFGIAKFVDDVSAKTTAKDALQGSVLYMSPEHVQAMKVTPRTDIYALGIILYRILYGEHPALIDVPDPTSWAVAAWHIQQMPRPLAEIAHWVPRHVSRLVSSACAKDQRDRPETMAAVSALATAARERYIAETRGELQGLVRNLSQPMQPGDPHVVLPVPGRLGQHFQPFHNDPEPPAAPAPPQAPAPAPVPPPRVVTPVQVQRTATVPPVSGRVAPPLALSKRRPRISANVWLITAAVSGALVFGVITKLYFVHKRSTASAAAAAPIVVAAPEPTPVQAAPKVPMPAPSAAPVAIEAPSPSVGATAEPVAPAPTPRKTAAKPKKPDASELRLKALEAELSRRQRVKSDPASAPLISTK